MNRWAPWSLMAIAGCLRPDSATVERLAQGGRAERLASIIGHGRAAPEVRAQAASWLLTSGQAPLAMGSLGDLVEGRRGPVVRPACL